NAAATRRLAPRLRRHSGYSDRLQDRKGAWLRTSERTRHQRSRRSMAAAALRQERHTDRSYGAQARSDTLLFVKQGSVYQMRTMSRKLRTSSVVFAPVIAEDHPLKIAQFRAWRGKEPVSNRRYTVVR